MIQIFTFVEPADLIRLSRTNKQLRTYLTTRSSSWIWRKSRVNAGDIPKIYPSITEIQFAYLLFEPLCSVRILFTSASLRVANNKSSSFANRRKSSMSFGLALFAAARTVWLKSAFLCRILIWISEFMINSRFSTLSELRFSPKFQSLPAEVFVFAPFHRLRSTRPPQCKLRYCSWA